ncbi:uncharacterized protein L969DRAFT_52025 [Mixia osmundae IAM 14324]|uniref:Transmembrane protein 188 n=1 Tax=Mixia osmundae (strain CBS 9802 / IAM 14324 / JCM 22182 / KY 12970) TaxID=764103 RepID=G7DWQ9_MIXOS|nr:uncharacterized protein L969DRAFT_106184 [Mixia osmundae IAM 14324]XP_014566741.1 uncharacterized protein L969DRAFT_52025 [Mixia osmundae IAM 14324]KEI36216.1 hypothetical protein L969DRAFT_106184 [Mixia osmundae IAM 14324]KEI38184.1 hypothetical protein L969DRAFT_52025 [Mixia osmundae IAM 14324]GAA95006.1 hypothetical protein E5Q_01661 [Mixia osmundae IAM 14324]
MLRFLGYNKDEARSPTAGANGLSDSTPLAEGTDPFGDIELPFASAAHYANTGNEDRSFAADDSIVSNSTTATSVNNISMMGHDPDSQNELMSELMSSQIILEASSYRTLSFEELEEMKRESKVLKIRLKGLQKRIALVSRMRDAATRLSATPSTSARQADEDDELDQDMHKRKLDELSDMLDAVRERQAEIAQRQLEHMVAVLALIIRKRDAQDQANKFLPADASFNLNASLSSLDTSLAKTHRSASARFDGPHFFAGHRDASPGGVPSRDLLTTPQMGSPNTFSTYGLSPARPAEISNGGPSRVEQQVRIEELELELQQARSQLTQQQQKLDIVQAEHRTIQSTAEQTRAELVQARAESSQMKAEQLPQPTFDDDRQKIASTLQQVFSRHQQGRGTLALSLGEIPPPPAGANTDQLTRYISESLDTHFTTTHGHLEKVENDLALAQASSDGTLASLRNELAKATSDRDARSRELADMQQTHNQQGQRALDLEAQLRSAYADKGTAVSTVEKQHEATKTSLASLTKERDSLTTKLQESETKLADALAREERAIKALSEVWKALPASEARLKVAESDDLKTFRGVFEGRRAIGALFNDLTSGNKFSVDSFVERVNNLLADDKKLVERLLKHEASQGELKVNADRAQKSLGEASASVEAQKAQIRDLEERLEGTSAKEVGMLEKLNDLQADHEKMRQDKRRLEANAAAMATVAQDKAQLEQELKTLRAQPDQTDTVKRLERELAEANDDIANLQDEVDDLKNNEQKNRVQLLNELSSLQNEAQTLRSQLRQLKRAKPQAAWYPPPTKESYRDLLVFEERLKQNHERLKAQKRRYEAFLLGMVSAISVLCYKVVIDPSPYAALHYLFVGALLIGCTTLVLFFATGMYGEKIGYARKFVPQANRALRSFNIYLNTRIASPYSRWSLWRRSPAIQSSVTSPTTASHPGGSPKRGPVSPPRPRSPSSRTPIAPIPLSENPRGELIFSNKVSPAFREGYERYRGEWERRRQSTARPSWIQRFLPHPVSLSRGNTPPPNAEASKARATPVADRGRTFSRSSTPSQSRQSSPGRISPRSRRTSPGLSSSKGSIRSSPESSRPVTPVQEGAELSSDGESNFKGRPMW